jgi:cytochrome c peroxidase
MLSYRLAFGNNERIDDKTIQRNVEIALDAYMRRLISVDAPFDRFIAGSADAIDLSAKRGFAVFVGKGMCAECHSGSMFTDLTPHVTGVADVTGDKGHRDTGAFYTPGLRNVAETGPYMHHGEQKTLTQVIEFYRWGGDPGGYVGEKDRLMARLDDLTEQDGRDLEAFTGLLCSGKCVDEKVDPLNCGSCGHACPGSYCSAGKCAGS